MRLTRTQEDALLYFAEVEKRGRMFGRDYPPRFDVECRLIDGGLVEDGSHHLTVTGRAAVDAIRAKRGATGR